jgi:superfamily I DNA and RNA helicase
MVGGAPPLAPRLALLLCQPDQFAMNSNVSNSQVLSGRPVLKSLFQEVSKALEGVADATGLFEFPLYQQDDGALIKADAVIIAPDIGIWVVSTVESPGDAHVKVARSEQIFSFLFSKLVKNPELRRKKTALRIDITEILYDPARLIENVRVDQLLCHDAQDLDAARKASASAPRLVALEALATLDGSKAIIKSKERVEVEGAAKKGNVAKILESEMALLDNKQRRAGSVLVKGPQRIRGIAGTGKTVVLAMKAALAHLSDRDATVVYTFYTKSLYQHVKRLITRFYRQFADHDPDWTRVHVMHGWGGRAYPGVYYDICRRNGVIAKTYADALNGVSKAGRGDPFNWACQQLAEANIKPSYDFVFIDEGQDFPNSFIDVCRRATKDGRIVWAYDEMQNIFDISIPTQYDVFGKNKDGTSRADIIDDIVLYKSYRNPREILTAAHALGFGIYSSRIIQMLESRQHWEDLGYDVIVGDCQPGDKMVIERNAANSSLAISKHYAFDDIISCSVFDSIEQETAAIADEIEQAIEDGLRPDDILVAIVDDRNAKRYADRIEELLSNKGVSCHSLYKDKFDIVDFNLERSVTIATVHKAKGNEAFQVFVPGIDALFFNDSPSSRNRLFTAITRAKGWVRLTGMGENAKACASELLKIKADFPKMKFNYPDPKQIRVMRRDLSQESKKKLEAERRLEELADILSPDEIRAILDRKK